MSISSISNTTTNGAALAALNTQLGATGGKTALGQQDFLNLLTTQLQNQDPLQPMQNTDFIAQMANFSSLQQMQALTKEFDTFTNNNLMASAQGFLGKQVTVTDPKLGDVSGTVTAVDASSGTPQITVNGVDYDISSIKNVTLNPTTGS